MSSPSKETWRLEGKEREFPSCPRQRSKKAVGLLYCTSLHIEPLILFCLKISTLFGTWPSSKDRRGGDYYVPWFLLCFPRGYFPEPRICRRRYLPKSPIGDSLRNKNAGHAPRISDLFLSLTKLRALAFSASVRLVRSRDVGHRRR